MNSNNSHFESFSLISGLGVTVIDSLGNSLFESDECAVTRDFLAILNKTHDCEESCRIAFIYGCYQAKRFGGSYLFFAPSGLVYCVAPLSADYDSSSFGVVVGPFLLTEHDDYMEFDVIGHAELLPDEVDALWATVRSIPYITAKKAQAVSEHLSHITAFHPSSECEPKTLPVHTDFFAIGYSIGQEKALQLSISRGDIQTANIALSDMIRQMLQSCGGNVEILRSRVVEFVVILSRVALKSGMDMNAFLGFDYGFIRDIDEFTSVEDTVIWLQTVSRRFIRLIFNFAETKHTDIILKAVDFIKRHHSSKITLDEIAAHLYVSKSYLCRIFKEATGQTPGNYITYVRIEESKKLLSNLNIKIIDIPDIIGFENQSYFTKIFKQHTGSTPAKYRRETL